MKVLISGGGIAGLTLAYWLQKVGVTPVVVEQANGMRHNGYGVDFYSTGYDVAERMQLVDQLRPHQIRAQYLAYLNEQGEPAAKLALDTMRQVLGGKYMALMHYTLEDVLYDAVRAQVEVRFNTAISALEQSADAVTATFSDGQSETFAL
ncbi:MAG: FAD-dependent monooxygenase, partial [Caldilineaceae bacterium]|nr:FAD-dependent monooxygenase [Caldilineaceae bacterium]